MTTYTAIADSEIDPESPGTTTLFTKLRDNPIAITEGASGAPQIQNGAIAAGAIHTAELSTGTNTSSTASTGGIQFTMTGGMYVFSPQIKASNASYSSFLYSQSSSVAVYTNSTSYVTAMAIYTSNAANTATAYWRYINTSPPYDMGDGDIPLFVFAQIDNTTKDIISVSVAHDPVWVHNGPTNCMPDGYDEKGGYQLIRNIPDELKLLRGLEKAQAIKSINHEKVYLTQDKKHADMDLIPHPWAYGNDLSGSTIVMLDPVSDCVSDLAELYKNGEDINELIHDNYLNIGNTQLNRVTPAGVLIPTANWKKTL